MRRLISLPAAVAVEMYSLRTILFSCQESRTSEIKTKHELSSCRDNNNSRKSLRPTNQNAQTLFDKHGEYKQRISEKIESRFGTFGSSRLRRLLKTSTAFTQNPIATHFLLVSMQREVLSLQSYRHPITIKKTSSGTRISLLILVLP